MFNSKSKTSVFLIVVFIFVFLILNSIDAQTASPQFLVSWRAQSYTPPWYQGKIFPTKGTPIEISFELIDGGKIVDLSKTKVRWYVNDELLRNEDNGLGIKFLRFTVPDYAGQETEIRIAIPDYKGNQLDSIVRIPSKAPEVVIRNNYLERRVQTGENLFEAIPYFFNINNLDNLSFNWFANEQANEGFSENPWSLSLNIDSQAPSGFVVNLRATAQNLLNQLEFTSRNLQLTVK